MNYLAVILQIIEAIAEILKANGITLPTASLEAPAAAGAPPRRGRPPAAAAAAAAAAKPAEAPAAAASDEITVDTLRAAATPIMEAKRQPELKALLTKFGVDSFSKLDAKHYPEALAAIEALAMM